MSRTTGTPVESPVRTTEVAARDAGWRGVAPRLWQASPPLVSAALLLGLVAVPAALAGLWLDARVITGMPAWLKPLKFALSTTIYSLTLAWIFTLLPAWPRTRAWVGWTTAVVFMAEVAIIGVQAWRGVTSHFNVATPLDATLFAIMGGGIVVQTLASVAVAMALWRQPFADRALGYALRLGMAITIVGAASGGLMTRPTGEQIEGMRGAPPLVVGAHTVGAPDGGAGLPGTGWSVEHGDLRVAHFVGLHALQALTVTGLIWPRRWSERRRARITVVAGASYVALFGILLWQALRGQPVVHPDALTLTVFLSWGAITAVAAWTAVRGEGRMHAPAQVF